MKTTINIKADKDVKEDAQRVAAELGMPLSVVMNAFLKEFIRNREVHFSVAPKMTPYLEKVLGGVEEDIKKGRNMSPAFSTGEEMDKYLNSLS